VIVDDDTCTFPDHRAGQDDPVGRRAGVKVLVIGGSGSSGVPVLHGLLARGHDVTMLHRGVHEPPGLPDVEHVHADPHFADTLAEAVGERTYDVVVGMYGRVGAIADVLADRCGHLVTVGGVPAYRGCIAPETVRPYGMAVNAREDGPLADEADAVPKFSGLIRSAERAVLDRAASGAYRGTVVRYPAMVYGPRCVVPWEWSVVRRVLDGRDRMILPDDGLWILGRCAARNAAEVVLRAVDNPEVADGQAYNAVDDHQFTVRQWAETVAEAAGGRLEFVGVPSSMARSALVELMPPQGRPHMLMDNRKAREELGYRDVVDARTATAEAVGWLRENPVTEQEYPLYPARFDYPAEDGLIDAYERAVRWVHEQAPDEPPAVRHPMPHPRRSGTDRDESGR
jgi:nucleoside-diphosphate-sugar epimerase